MIENFWLWHYLAILDQTPINKSWFKCWFHIAPYLCRLPECFGPTYGILAWAKIPHFKVCFCSSRPKRILASTVFGRRATPTFFGFFTLSLNHRKPLAWEWPWDSFFEIMAGDWCSLNLLCVVSEPRWEAILNFQKKIWDKRFYTIF